MKPDRLVSSPSFITSRRQLQQPTVTATRTWVGVYSTANSLNLFPDNSAVAEAEKGFKIRRYPYRRYNKLKLVWFWPEGCLVFEKWCCSCRFCVQHAKLTHCLPKTAKNGQFHIFSYFLKHATQTRTKLHNTDLFHVRDIQAYKSRHLKYFGTH